MKISNIVSEGDVVQFPKKHRGDISNMHDCPKCGGDLQGGKYMGHEVQVCMPCKQVYLPPNSGIDQKGNPIKEAGVAEGSEDFKARLEKRKATLTPAQKAASEKIMKKTANGRGISNKELDDFRATQNKQGVAEAMGEHEFKSANGPVSVTTEPGRTVVKRKEWDNSGSGSDSDSGTLNAPALGGTRKSDYDSGDYSDERSMDEAEQQKGADYRDPPEADYGDDYQAMVKRMKQLAGAGPLKTVYDPTKRVYKNVPTAVQPKK